MSSSGLIYAVIVGAWAAYLVPMWLRRQDELNEARPTERFSTAIRLLSGRAAMERRYAKGLAAQGGRTDDASDARDPDAAAETADVRDFDAPADEAAPPAAQRQPAAAPGGAPSGSGAAVSSSSSGAVFSSGGTPSAAGAASAGGAVPSGGAASAGGSGVAGGAAGGAAPRSGKKPGSRRPYTAERMKRAKVLARRRRTTTVLFLAFTVGTIVAAVGGLAFLWAPAIPAILLSAYIVYLRAQERRRFTFTMDQRQAEAAAQRLREGRPRPPQASQQPAADEPPAEDAAAPLPDPAHPAAPAARPEPASTAGRRALVEETDHAEWVDQQRERDRTEPGGWDPVPVPLPTYVTAPVAPRATSHVDLDADDAWSSARSGPATETPHPPAVDPRHRPATSRRTRGRTPLFDQYADNDRPRAANE
ncbi:gephyrin-like molybdotransferase receptor GlpR [Streptomyces rimosus]|uniref:divisome protein SepX/GlpR n=1 Tax=Streptomyces rimosus TaxID=1927 RepID=UPI0004CBE8C0|nr:gephyrin-like molybdotransferase receptor GlpR [Streptomyces rimosus]